MPKLLFRGAHIRFVDVRYDDRSKMVYTKVNFTAVFSDPIRQAMEWGEPPAGFASADLDGEMVATHFILTPNGRELKQHEIQLDAREIAAFKLVRVNNDDESTSNELRFQVTSAAPDAPALLADYLKNIGKGEGQLRVNFEEQSELAMEEEKDSERLISQDQANDTAEEDEDGEGEPVAAAPTISPAVLVTGSHQRHSKKDRQQRERDAESRKHGALPTIDAETEEIVN